MVEHTTRAFDSDLQELTKKILDKGRSDDEQITNAIKALLKRDAALARSVIAADDFIDAQQHDIEEKAITTIARRQPMAVDLREIVGALRISNDLERIGDLAENIAKRVLLLTGEFRIEEVMLQLQRMAQLARATRTGVAKLSALRCRRSPGGMAQGPRDRCA
jgi:phosphate transport system protein